jgi:arginine N-succinyltransferase
VVVAVRDVITPDTDWQESKSLIASGHLVDFRCTFGYLQKVEGGVAIDAASAALLGKSEGDKISHVSRW